MMVLILKIFLRRFQRYITHACSIKTDKARLGLKIAQWAFSRQSLKKMGQSKRGRKILKNNQQTPWDMGQIC